MTTLFLLKLVFDLFLSEVCGGFSTEADGERVELFTVKLAQELGDSDGLASARGANEKKGLGRTHKHT